MRGTVAWFHRSFGFITPQDGAVRDVFVHHTGIVGEGFKTLAGGDKVEFDVGSQDGTGKPIAVNVRLVAGAKLED